MGVNVKGMVFRNEHETNGETWYSYSISVSSKSKEGEWINKSVPIRFRKGVQIPDRTRIDITDGWPIVIPYKDGNIVGFFANEYEVIDKTKEPEGFSQLVDEDIPF